MGLHSTTTAVTGAEQRGNHALITLIALIALIAEQRGNQAPRRRHVCILNSE
jgi:hypothetical protein